MKHGKYIVIEGNDGTGKSTQAEQLAQWLEEEKKIETFVTHEPDGPGISAEIRKVIKNGELERDGETNLLLFTASRHEIWKRAQHKLSQGKWVISARNYISTLVYQGYGEGIDFDRIIATTEEFTDEKYIHPDLTVILGLSHDERERRIAIADRGKLENKDTFESRGRDFQNSLDQGYEKIAEKYNFPIIDASKSIEDIQAEIRKLIDPALYAEQDTIR